MLEHGTRGREVLFRVKQSAPERQPGFLSGALVFYYVISSIIAPNNALDQPTTVNMEGA